MKKTMKFLAVLSAFIILVSSFLALPVSAATVTYTTTSVSGSKGDTVTISVKMSSSVAIWGANVSLGFNSSELQYVSGSATKGNVVSGGSLNPTSSSINFSGMYSAKSGTVFTAKFKILKSSGTSTLTLSSSENTDENGTVHSCSASGGTVTIVKAVTGITLNKTSVTLKKGDTTTLSATVSPSDATNKTVTYSSSNTNVATVNSSGKITAVGGGTATITAKAGGKTATCTVKVTVAQTGIKVSGNADRSVGVGSTISLSVVKIPSDATDSYAVSWTSSDPSIATVSSKGTVTGVKLGTTTITAKSNGWTASYKITVVEQSQETTTEQTSEETSTTEPLVNDVTDVTEATTEAVTEITEETTAEADSGTISKIKDYFQGVIIRNSNSTVTKLRYYVTIAIAIAVVILLVILTAVITWLITSKHYNSKMQEQNNNGSVNNADITGEKPRYEETIYKF